MKATTEFQQAIESAMDDRALNDPAFMEAYSNSKKSLKDCVTYILNQVKESGVNGFADSEIFDMAAEYYTTKDIKVGKAQKGQVVINRTVELTEGEKQEAKDKAFEELKNEIKSKARKKPTAKKKAEPKTSVEKAGEAQAKKKAEAKKKADPPPQPTLF